MKNKVQFQKGLSLSDFFQHYETNEKCSEALFKWRWPDGYICPECGSTSYCSLKTRKLYQCNHCHHQNSLTSGTIFASTNLPLTTWFLAIHLITQSKTGIAALELKRQLGVSYNTAWSMKQKIMQVMKERDDSKALTGVVQLDDVYWGGERRGQRGHKRGRGSANKTPFVTAVLINEEGHPIRMHMCVIKGFRLKEISRWAKRHLSPESAVVSDGLACFFAVKEAGFSYSAIVTGGGPDSVAHTEFLWVNTMIGNVKNALVGTYHAINHKHLPRYLAEFCYRFNRRFQLEDMLPGLCYVATRTPPMPLRLLSMAENYG